MNNSLLKFEKIISKTIFQIIFLNVYKHLTFTFDIIAKAPIRTILHNNVAHMSFFEYVHNFAYVLASNRFEGSYFAIQEMLLDRSVYSFQLNDFDCQWIFIRVSESCVN